VGGWVGEWVGKGGCLLQSWEEEEEMEKDERGVAYHVIN